ncbi:hypothetical protein [Spirosoma aerolatum]|uniref:hypothetical protein n=1 Tax=Spirosoma aerolatum TaxID=1211326 RepID=UPI0009AD14C7|nr:hypothetical protein [Spirosoma aerolatum]
MLPISAVVNLKAGYHPFRIYYHYTGEGKPILEWKWQTEGIAEHQLQHYFMCLKINRRYCLEIIRGVLCPDFIRAFSRTI